MKSIYSILLFITIFGGTWRLGRTTCVLESDFGIVLNCAFKKSGLFRVRNLGGVKAHIGLGFSLGDELGFKESISNTEVNRRRSTQVSNLQAQLIEAQQKQQKQQKGSRASNLQGDLVNPMTSGAVRRTSASSSGIPPFKPIPPAAERPNVHSASNGTNSNIHPSLAKVMAVVAIPKKSFNNDLINNKFSDRISHTNNEITDNTLPQQPPPPQQQKPSSSLQAILAANNITEETLALAIQRQNKRKTTTTSTTTSRPVTSKFKNSVGKVMNAPKEYYPVGYDKNFDDNFAARVELPQTSFYCGDQKHFPGLYADEDLGCMVFHVCALTDDGLLMKSFLCPESTLFDQEILKCNWWFYVDCKNSKTLYDSNIPISKSYQLMKALTFFSTYKRDNTSSNNATTTKTSGKV